MSYSWCTGPAATNCVPALTQSFKIQENLQKNIQIIWAPNFKTFKKFSKIQNDCLQSPINRLPGETRRGPELKLQSPPGVRKSPKYGAKQTGEFIMRFGIWSGSRGSNRQLRDGDGVGVHPRGCGASARWGRGRRRPILGVRECGAPSGGGRAGPRGRLRSPACAAGGRWAARRPSARRIRLPVETSQRNLRKRALFSNLVGWPQWRQSAIDES